MGLVWMWPQRIFGLMIDSAHSSTSGYLILSHHLIVNLCLLATEDTNRYDQRVREIEHGSFTPLVFNTLGGIGPTASVVFKRVSSMIADKSGQPYNSVIRLIRCKLIFSLLRSTITCLRGSRSLMRNDHCLDNGC